MSCVPSECTSEKGAQLRVGGVSSGEQQSLLSYAVEARGVNPRAAVGTHVRKRGIIGDAEQNIRTRGIGGFFGLRGGLAAHHEPHAE